jgi:hypothetical protein
MIAEYLPAFGNEADWLWWLALVGLSLSTGLLFRPVKKKMHSPSANSHRPVGWEDRAKELEKRLMEAIAAIPPAPSRQISAQDRCIARINSWLIAARDEPVSAMEVPRLTLLVQELLVMSLSDVEKLDRLFQYEYGRSRRRPCEVLELVIERWRRDLETFYR